jgi:putative endonuclease
VGLESWHFAQALCWYPSNHHNRAIHSPINLVIPTEGRNLLLAGTKRYYVYIMASKSRVLYVGVTGFLMPRVLQHKSGVRDGFTQKYRITRLVHYESFQYVYNAIARETEIKKWRREKKVTLIESSNPTWEDLAADWGKPIDLRFLHSSPPPTTDSSPESGSE